MDRQAHKSAGPLATATFANIVNPGLDVSNHDRANREVKGKINILLIELLVLKKYRWLPIHSNFYAYVGLDKTKHILVDID